jgi:hypothetical protein
VYFAVQLSRAMWESEALDQHVKKDEMMKELFSPQREISRLRPSLTREGNVMAINGILLDFDNQSVPDLR